MIARVKTPAYTTCGAVAIILSLSMTHGIAQAVDGTPQLQVDKQGVLLVVQQRRSKPIPGSNGSIVISISDITGEMVLVSLNDEESATLRRTPATILRETPMAAGECAEFEVDDRAYVLFLQRLHNVLIGDDTAEFKIVHHQDVTDAMKKADTDKASRSQEIKIAGRIETSVSGRLELLGIEGKSAELRLDDKPFRFSVDGSQWVYLSHDEILQVNSVSAERGAVAIELYHPAPFPRPF